MSLAGFVFAAGAAIVHAGWNLLLARERDTHAAAAAALVTGCVALAPAAVLTWRVDSAALPYAAGSTVLELAYFALLALAYQRGDLSAVYPLARGSAPVLVVAGSAIVAARAPSALVIAGVVLVGAGVLAVRGARWEGAAMALGVGACIAGYTILDKHGVQHASPLAYLELVLILPAVVYAIAMRKRLRGALSASTMLAGVGTAGAYALVLAALQHASAAAVSAVRESSVVIGVGLAAVFLHEDVTRTRLFGAVLVAGGVACVALG